MSSARTSHGRVDGVIVRAPNHLGDLVMALPALTGRDARCATGDAGAAADVVVVRGLTPLLEMAGGHGEVLPLDRGMRGFWAAVGELRRRRYARGVLLTPSFGSALLFAAGGVAHRRGTPTDARGALLHDGVPVESLRAMHRASAYVLLATGHAPDEPPAPALDVPDDARDRFSALAGPDAGRPTIGLFPGSNASSRRWDADRYASLARRLAREGVRVLVFGGTQEARLTAQVAGEAALDLGGRTDLPMLAAGLAACRLLVSNDSGPMHLAAAVGTPTVTLQGPADPVVTRPLGERHVMLRHPELPCVPCVKNVCPRSGRGYVLPDATRECLRLISVDDALETVRAHPAMALTSP
ncbi:MAG TPA: glycosyltransferase family 9 protein [Gemmatimonadaceae bacterium]|nr:glycosyltransferase family 9 protein [Gemmatimonadaceae bacterium]